MGKDSFLNDMEVVMRTIFMCSALVLLAGCVQPLNPTFYATDGSKADATITMAYGPLNMMNERVDAAKLEAEGDQVALEKCSSWGYSKAEAFGGVREVCSLVGGYGSCLRANQVIEYQCIK